MKFGLTSKDWQILLDKLEPLVKLNAELWVFGSRATGSFKEFSDIDILFRSPQKLPTGLLSQIRDALEESALSIKVDLVDESELASSYKENVLNSRVKMNVKIELR